jgi:pyridoxamine 5'-phosphate oxidase
MSIDAINKDLSEIRREYVTGSLHKADLKTDPFAQFDLWYQQADEACRYFPNTMTLATVNKGEPYQRVVLLKGYDQRGFVFYTNRSSRKGHQLAENSQVALTLFWEELERQVNIRGHVELTSDEESDRYFATRPRGSQLGAWASEQSTRIESRKTLTDALEKYTAEFEGKDVPRPPDWGGYRVIPQSIEFWQGQPDRLHDRFIYTHSDRGWSIQRLSP